MSGAAVIHKQNKYIELFNRYGAVDAEHAMPLEELGIKRSFIFDRMAGKGVFTECEEGKFYINNQAVARFKEQRRKKALAIMLFLLLFVLIYYLVAGKL